MYLIAFEIDAIETVKELNTEHGWKTWNWATAVRLCRNYFSECVEIASISNAIKYIGFQNSDQFAHQRLSTINKNIY